MRVRTLAFICYFGVAASAFAQGPFHYEDITNPTGIGDFSQRAEPICMAAAYINNLWHWDAQKYGQQVQPARLLPHTKQTDFTSDWRDDAWLFTSALANRIYGPKGADGNRTGGVGPIAGVMRFANDFGGNAYNRQTNPDGLTIEFYDGPKATLAKATEIITKSGLSTVAAAFSWRDKDGKATADQHAFTLTGIDTKNGYMRVSNPWGDHTGNGDQPVNEAYYDTFKYDTSKSQIVFTDDGNNQDVFSRFNDATFTATTLQVEHLFEVRQGGSPNLVAQLLAPQTLEYTIQNPEWVDPVSAAFLLLDDSQVNLSLVAQRMNSALIGKGWVAEILDPNNPLDAVLFSAFGVNDPDVTAEYDLDGWQSGATGIRLRSLTGGLLIGQSLVFEFDLTGVGSLGAFNDAYILSDANRWQAISGATTAVPEPGTLIAVGAGIAALLRRQRRSG